jgi:hypothetical protein
MECPAHNRDVVFLKLIRHYHENKVCVGAERSKYLYPLHELAKMLQGGKLLT